jgi:hypothetical protein
MSLGIGLWVRDTALRLRGERVDLNRSVLSGFTKTEYTQTGMYTSTDLKENPYQMQVNKDDFEDLRWLLR